MVAQSAKFTKAIADSKKLKAKPTDDELLEVRPLSTWQLLRHRLSFRSSAGLANMIGSCTPISRLVLRIPSSRMPRNQEPLISRSVRLLSQHACSELQFRLEGNGLIGLV